ncbi:MAG: [Fe-Fe] hydrogenase large subunit C-terminal domain-containing protein [Candidatus Sumerlaeota bacterium]
MKHRRGFPLVETIGERCRVCYTCVRECPAKAIRVADGQAEVIEERCIGCGNCVRVCSQSAKLVLSGSKQTEELLAGDKPVAACIAPTFPAEFTDMETEQLVGMIKALGFDHVVEVAFGADLVAQCYNKLLIEHPNERYIATSCPAVVAYVERFAPEVVPNLAPIVSPMVAMARVIHEMHGKDTKVVFIGPCIAKKGEAASNLLPDEIDEAITYRELRDMFNTHEISPEGVAPQSFDPPEPGRGALFPISRGMLQAAGITEDLMSGSVVATDGRTNFAGAIKEFSVGALDAQLLEVLCCNGCIMGAGMTTSDPLFRRRSHVSRHVRKRVTEADQIRWKYNMERFEDLNLSRTYQANPQGFGAPPEEELLTILERLGKFRPEDELNCGACGYDTCREHAIAIHRGRAEAEMCLPHTIEQLRETVGELAVTQEALVHSEKLASMGQLAAGIAHEVNNPLGIVLMYAHLILEEVDQKSEQADDLKMLVEQADRCKKIISGLLNFARQRKVEYRSINLRELVDRAMQIIKAPHNMRIELEHEIEEPDAEIDPDQVIQVITNLANNAIGAMEDSGSGALKIRTFDTEDEVGFQVSDTGTGIALNNLNKIFEPFFSTKTPGKGTGLGLAVTYGIVKMHRGQIDVDSNANPEEGPTGTTFTVRLPRRHMDETPEEAIEAVEALQQETEI